ncbi:hypothetical protein [Nitrosomonas ureae]|uniref:Uncharacterized protein n=1 Tax=Nitrosomonas ureae TaxID=44577 RepID=A0A1H9FII4_9PROT|nr:hypothetical protein [Nitrosomonas ureae]SEQ37313.1 hypothetical protein SAMN05421510_104317 [Nitrosomonas ureae]
MNVNDILLTAIVLMTLAVTYYNVKEQYELQHSFKMALGGGFISFFVTLVYSVLFWLGAFIFSWVKEREFSVLETLLYIPAALLLCAILTVVFSLFFKISDNDRH